MLDDVVLAADHLAVAALESPDAAAGADVHVVNAFRAEFLGAADVVVVIGIAAVDEDVAGFELGDEIVERGVDDAGGNHEPDGAGLLEFLDEVVERVAAGGAFAGKLFDGLGAAVVDDAAGGHFSEGGAPCWRPSCRDRSFRVAFASLLMMT